MQLRTTTIFTRPNLTFERDWLIFNINELSPGQALILEMRFRLIPSRFSITWKRFFSSSGGTGTVDTRKAGMDRATIHPPNKLRLADANWAGTLWINLATTKIAIYSNRCTVLPSKISVSWTLVALWYGNASWFIVWSYLFAKFR